MRSELQVTNSHKINFFIGVQRKNSSLIVLNIWSTNPFKDSTFFIIIYGNLNFSIGNLEDCDYIFSWNLGV